MVKLKTQIWCAREKSPISLDLSKFQKVENYLPNKPIGGLWTSTYTPDEEYCSEWIEWLCFNAPEWVTGNCYLLIPEDNIKVYEIDKAEDLEKLFEKYGFDTPFGCFINWEKVCKDYDAIHLTSAGQWRTREGTPKYGDRLNLYGWETESTLWCKPKFKKIIPITKIKNRKCKIFCYLGLGK